MPSLDPGSAVFIVAVDDSEKNRFAVVIERGILRMLWGSPGGCMRMNRPTRKPKNRIIIFSCTIFNLCFYSQNYISLWANVRYTLRFPQACFLRPIGERVTRIIHIIWPKNNFSTGHWNYCSQVAGKTNSKCYHPPCHAKLSYCKKTPLKWCTGIADQFQFYNRYHWSTERYKYSASLMNFFFPGCKLGDVFFNALSHIRYLCIVQR